MGNKSTSIYINAKVWEEMQGEFPEHSAGKILGILWEERKSVPDIPESIPQSIPENNVITREEVQDMIDEAMERFQSYLD